MPVRLEELRADLKNLGDGGTEAAGSLRSRLHRLAGSGGSFGFLDLSAIAREAEHALGSAPGQPGTNGLPGILDPLEDAVRRAEAQLAASAAGKAPAVTPRALLVMRAS